MSGRCALPQDSFNKKDKYMQELGDDAHALLVQQYKNILPTLKDSELVGLTKQVCVYSRIKIKCKHTGRLIGFAADKDGQRYSCSYVQVCSVRVGRICMCFTHEFSNKTREFVLVDIFPEPKQDADSSLWWVSVDDSEAVYQYVLDISCSSVPLVTAKEKQKLWFLTLFE